MTTTYEIVYKDFENELKYMLSSEDVDGNVTYPNMTAITSMSLFFKEKFYSSDDYADVFDWTTYAASYIVVLKLGMITDIDTGKDANAELIVYSSDYPEGKVWGTLALNVVELVEAA